MVYILQVRAESLSCGAAVLSIMLSIRCCMPAPTSHTICMQKSLLLLPYGPGTTCGELHDADIIHDIHMIHIISHDGSYGYHMI